jgi:hypothetical protein
MSYPILRRSILILLLAFTGLSAVPGNAGPNKAVLGYSCYWFDELYPATAYNYEGLTHIVRSFLIPLPDGSIPVSPSFFEPTLTTEAKKYGVKLIASLGGGAAGDSPWFSIAKNEAYRTRFFNELDKLITDHGYDGVDVDWEPGSSNKEQEAVFTGFMKALRARFPKWVITTALGAGEWSAKYIDWEGLAPNVDYFNIMTYDFAGNWGDKSAHPANLFDSDKPERNSGINTAQAMTMLIEKYHVKPEQLLLGIPFYGREFFGDKLGDKFTPHGPKAGVRHYYEIAPMLRDKKTFQYEWDEAAQQPILSAKSSKGVVGFDDAKAVAAKCKYVNDKNLGGIIIWNLGADFDGNHAVLLDQVAKSFGSTAKAIPADALEKIHATLQDILAGTWDSLVRLQQHLLLAGKVEEAKKADPGKDPRFGFAKAPKRAQLSSAVRKLQEQLGVLEQKTFEGWDAASTLPHYEKPGVKPENAGKELLLEDFEKDSKRWSAPAGFTVERDPYRLGTQCDLETVEGGSSDSPKLAGHFSGHLGMGREPYPRALLKFMLTRKDGQSADLSEYKAVQFWVKGDGNSYHLTLGQEEMGDGAYYGVNFDAPKSWTKVTLSFDKMKSAMGISPFSWENQFTNPGSGQPVPLDFFLHDVQFISIGLVNATGDADFDLTIDQVELLK